MTVIKQWEEAGLALSDSLNTYLSACIQIMNMGPEMVVDSNIRGPALVNSALSPEGLHATLAQQLVQSRSILAQARNNMLASSLYRLPEEILVKVFTNFIYSRRRNTVVYMGQTIKSIYKRLHTLLAVCSIWRKIGISHSELWFLVPVIHGDPGFSAATTLSLQRASGTNLCLGAILRRNKPVDIKEVAAHIGRFQSVNILAESGSVFRETFDQLLCADVPTSLSELSLHLDYESEPGTDITLSLKQRFFFESTYPYLPQFTKLLGSASKIRLSGAGVHWDQAVFSNRLVEVRLEDCVLGYQSDLDVLLAALASASELRSLSLISITTFANVYSTIPGLQERGGDLIASLPKLKAIHLEDLCFNTLQAVIKSIAQGSHDLTLFLTPRCLLVAAPTESRCENIGFDAVCEVVSVARASVLMLSAKHEWLNEREFGMILRSVPSLKTLKMERWRFQGPICQALAQPHSFDPTFPRIESLLLTLATINDPQKFKDMISSHVGSLQKMVLGVAFYSKATQPCIPYRGLVHWLESQVSSFRLVSNNHTPPEFGPRVWQL